MLTDKGLYLTFEKVFREQYNQLANYACSILNSRADAEDVVQDVFVRIWKNSPQIIESPQLKFYLLTSVKNGCISFLRREGNRNHMQPEEAQLHLSAVQPLSEEREDPLVLAEKALALLPPQCQAIFRLSRFGKLTYAQIADELGLSVKTVENQMGKALRIMREYARQHQVRFSLLLLFISAYGGQLIFL